MSAWNDKIAGLGVVGGRSLLVIIAIVVAVIAAQRVDLRFDASANRNFTLDPVLREIIDGVDTDTRIVAIWPRESGRSEIQWQAAVGSLVEPALNLIARQSPRITYTHIDSELDLPLLEQLREQHEGIASGAIYLLRRDGDTARRPFRIPLSAALPTIMQREIGGALITLGAAEAPLVAMLQGHGELRPGGGSDNGANTLLRTWELSGFQVLPFDSSTLSRLGRLPSHAVVVIAGPTNPLGESMISHLDQHLRDGGPLLVLADHRLDPALAHLLRRRGILIAAAHPPSLSYNPLQALSSDSRHNPRLVYSEQHSIGRDGSFHRLILRPQSSLHDDPMGIMRNTRNGGRLINATLSVPVSVLDPRLWPGHSQELSQALDAAGVPTLRAAPLLSLSAGSAWVDSPMPRQQAPADLDQLPAVPLAWAVEYAADEHSAVSGRGARVVIWGSRQSASDGILAGDGYANGQLLSDMLGWLSDRGSQVTIPPADFKAFRVSAEPGTITLLLALLVALIPCSCLGGAMIAWWERR